MTHSRVQVNQKLTRMRVKCHAIVMENDFQFADSTATRMLAEGLARANEEQGLSIRQLGKQLGYKQAVVLSHMANGRVPIPIDRAEDFADALRLDKRSFLQAVIKQRHPAVSWHLLSTGQSGSHDSLAQELEAILGASLKGLSKEQRAVMREVAADAAPRRRWLSVHEIPTVEMLRDVVPAFRSEGLDGASIAGIEALLESGESDAEAGV